MNRKLARGGFWVVALWLLGEGAAEACSCIKERIPTYQVLPRDRALHRDEHFWLHSKKTGEFALFVGEQRLKADFRPVAGWFEVVPLEPMPPQASVEIRVNLDRSWKPALQVQTDEHLAEKLPAGGELRKAEAWDAANVICSKGDPEAELTFAPFEGSNPEVVPYIFWFGPEPLDTNRPPDHIDFIKGSRLDVRSGFCLNETYWLPQGDEEIRIAAATVAPNGARGSIVGVPFAMALGEGDQQTRTSKCKQDEEQALTRWRAEQNTLLETAAPLLRFASGARKAAVVPGVGLLALGALALLRRARAMAAASALCTLLAGAALGAAEIKSREGSALVEQAAKIPRPPDAHCTEKYPRSRRPLPPR